MIWKHLMLTYVLGKTKQGNVEQSKTLIYPKFKGHVWNTRTEHR